MKRKDKLYRGRYRIESDRFHDWDYTESAWYFITICTRNKEPFFGVVINDMVQLSAVGIITYEEWMRTEKIRSYVCLDESVTMPNHLHGIIKIEKNKMPIPESVETHNCASLHSHLRRQPHSLGSIIAGFKSAATKRIRATECQGFAWQRGFYDISSETRRNSCASVDISVSIH